MSHAISYQRNQISRLPLPEFGDLRNFNIPNLDLEQVGRQKSFLHGTLLDKILFEAVCAQMDVTKAFVF